MSTVDPLTALAAEFDRPVAPRPEFAAALGDRLLAELRTSPSTTPESWRATLPGMWPFSVRPRTRFVLAVIVLLLFLTGVAAATYLTVYGWVGEGARGPQATMGYRLTSIYRAPRSTWMDVYPAAAVSTDGRFVYLAHRGASGQANILRVPADGRAGAVAEPLLDLSTVKDPIFYSGAAWDGLATAPNGDLFVIGASGSQPPLAMTAIAVRQDGSYQTLVTLRDLRRAGLVSGGRWNWASDDQTFSIAASAPDRVWLRARVSRRPVSDGPPSPPRPPYNFENALFEIVDPNADGDWRDRVITRVSVPDSVPGFNARGRSPWWYGQLVSEPAVSGGDSGGSILLAATALLRQHSGVRRSILSVVRVRDLNGDGDVVDAGEVVRLFRGRAVGFPQIASRLDTSGSRPRNELVIAGLHRSDRIAAVSETGQVTDIARSFPGWGSFGLLADMNGGVFATLGFDVQADGMQERIYRLQPGRVHRSVVPTLAPQRVPSSPGGSALLAITTADKGSPAFAGSSYWIRADGTRRRIVGAHAGDLCRSTTGSKLAFTSDIEVPRENFVYLATIGGSAPTKISERPFTPVCPFDGRSLVLSSLSILPEGPVWELRRYDVRTRKIVSLVAHTPRFSVSPNGRELVYVEQSPDGENLVLLDVRTGRRRRLAGPLVGRSFAPSTGYTTQTTGAPGDDLQWSPDGTKLAVSVGRAFDFARISWSGAQVAIRPRRYLVSIIDTRDATVRRRVTISGGPPTLSWSPDGTQVLVCTPLRGPDTGCGNHTPRGGSEADYQGSVLRLVDLSGGDTAIARGAIRFAGWRPHSNTYVWADDLSLHFGASGAKMRLRNFGGAWLGWSPDGRYLALGPGDGYAVVDVRTGARHTLVHVSQQYMVRSVAWWAP